MDQFWLRLTGTAIFLATAAIAVILIRRRRFRALLPRAAMLIPPRNSVVWRQGIPPILRFELTESLSRQQPETLTIDSDDLRYGAATGDAIIAVPLITAAEVLNLNVMDALERWQNNEEAFSGIRLADYVLEHHATIFSAENHPAELLDTIISKHGALDAASVAGVAGGGLLGASAGQLLGALLDPTGKTAAVVLLGVGGAILGRMSSDRLKRKNFQVAVERYNETKAIAIGRIENQRRIAQMSIQHFVDDRDKALRDAINEERRRFLAAVRDGRTRAGNERHLACEAFVSHLGGIQARISDGFNEFRAKHQSSIITRLLYTTEGDVAVELARRWAQDASNRVDSLRTFLLTLLSSTDERKREEAARVICEFIQTCNCDADRYYDEIKVHANRVAALEQVVEDQAKAVDARLKELLTQAQEEVNDFIDITHVQLHERLDEIMKPVLEAREHARTEGRKLGKTIS